MKQQLFEALASAITARRNVRDRGEDPTAIDWMIRHGQRAEALTKEHMPSGAGFDNGTWIDLDASDPDCLVLHTSFHHMSDVGMYDGWTEHTVRVKPSFVGRFTLTVSGKNRREIKDHIADEFRHCLEIEISD